MQIAPKYVLNHIMYEYEHTSEILQFVGEILQIKQIPGEKLVCAAGCEG